MPLTQRHRALSAERSEPTDVFAILRRTAAIEESALPTLKSVSKLRTHYHSKLFRDVLLDSVNCNRNGKDPFVNHVAVLYASNVVQSVRNFLQIPQVNRNISPAAI